MADAHLLLITAHPDDEVLHFGGLAYLTARAGGHVTLVCATRGEVGEIADYSLATPDTLGSVRAAELRAAAALLGIEDVRLLDYRDSGMAGAAENEHPNAFIRVAAEEVLPLLAQAIRDVRPHVVATWAPDGGYGHPDHVVASRHATAAYALAGRSAHPELGEPWSPGALYYAARPPDLRDAVRAELAARGHPAGQPPTESRRPASAALPVSIALDVSPSLAIKKAARAAHRTQLRADSWIGTLSPELEQQFTGTEYFYRARPSWHESETDDLLPRLLGLGAGAARA